MGRPRVASVFTDLKTEKEIRQIERLRDKEECNTLKRQKKRKIIGKAVIRQKAKITLV